MAVGVAALALLAGCSGSGAHPADPAAPVAFRRRTGQPAPEAGPSSQWAGRRPRLPLGARLPGDTLPIRIIIPKIGVATLDRLGRAPDGTVEVPGPDRWRCPAGMSSARDRASSVRVILGHVDSKRGPAVFFRLRELRGGDEIEVTRADGSSVRVVQRPRSTTSSGSRPMRCTTPR